MLKKISQSDISIRPFKVYKSWTVTSASLDVSLLEAEKGNNFSEDITIDHHHAGGYVEHNHLTFNKHALWSQINTQFYNPVTEYNPFYALGPVPINYNTNPETKDRVFADYVKVISIPQKYIGESIKKGSLSIIDNELPYADDGKGNIVRAGGYSIIVTSLDLETNNFTFQDLEGTTYTAIAENSFIDLNDGYVNIIYNTTEYILELSSYDINEERMTIKNIPFLSAGATSEKYGNVFYEHGLIVVTKKPGVSLTGDWIVSFKSTDTVYEYEVLLSTNPDEFNVSTNPTAVIEVGKEEEEWEINDGTDKYFTPYTTKVQTYPGRKYIRKMSYDDLGNELDYRYQSQISSSVFGGFEHYDISGSVDFTGSFLAPYITTIGLYDDECNLVAVAKLPQPIKSLPDVNLNFLVRFDV